jgi:hypothetical protein
MISLYAALAARHTDTPKVIVQVVHYDVNSSSGTTTLYNSEAQMLDDHHQSLCWISNTPAFAARGWFQSSGQCCVGK